MNRISVAMRLVVSLWALSVASDSIRAADVPDAKQIAQWVQELDDDRFKARESATLNLIKAGRPAVAAVGKAATSSSPEVTERALRVLRTLLTSSDRGTAHEAQKALTILAGSDHTRAASKARSILLVPIMYAVTALQQGGAVVQVEGGRVVAVYLDDAKDPVQLLPLLHRLPDLHLLSISNKKMDDEGMAMLKGLPKLAELNLFGSLIGDEGLKVLKTLPSLRHVAMGNTRVTDAGLVHVRDLTQLDYLGLRGNNVTDAGLVHLKKLTNLTGLYLGETWVTDAGLVHLKGMVRMNYLRLHNVKVTDAGLEHLKGMKNLTRLELWGTKVTEAGVAGLREALPNLKVETVEPR